MTLRDYGFDQAELAAKAEAKIKRTLTVCGKFRLPASEGPLNAAMFTSASNEKREMLPRSRSFKRGWVTPQRRAGFRLRPSLALYNGGDASRQHNVYYRSLAIVFTI